MGYQVYVLRRFIGTCFDIYFHLWNDGVAYRESDKRHWEIEQGLEWTTVQSKKQRKGSKHRAVKWIKKKTLKKVRFAENLVQDSPVKKFALEPLPIRLTFGAFHTAVLPDQLMHNRTFGRLVSGRSAAPVSNLVDIPVKSVFSRIFSDLNSEFPITGIQAGSSLGADISRPVQNSNDAVFCSRCLDMGLFMQSGN